MPSISSVMKTELVTVDKKTPILEAIDMLVRFNITGLPVVNKKDELIGIVSEKDLLKLTYGLTSMAYDSNKTPETVAEIMTTDVQAFEISDSLVSVCKCLMEKPFRRVPIVDNKKLIGIISRRDLLAMHAAALPA